MTDNQLLDECRTLASVVCPELLAHPLYVCDASTFDGLPIRDDSHGWEWHVAEHHGALKAALGDQWEGAGTVICLYLDDMRKDFGQHYREFVLQTMVHELGHAVPVWPPPIGFGDLADIDADVCLEWDRERIAKTRDQPMPEVGSTDDAHDHRFIRRCCHLWGRAELDGYNIPLQNLFGGSVWFCSQPPLWIAVLFAEIVQMRTATFAEIESVAPPAGFTDLWEASVENLKYWRAEPREKKRMREAWEKEQVTTCPAE